MRAMEKPGPMTIDAALASEDPIFEIAVRLADKPVERMSEPEKVFWAVSYFLDDPLNGGDFVEVVGEFARRYGPPELAEIAADLDATRLEAIEDDVRASLVEMAKRNRAAFDLLPAGPAQG